MEKNECEHTKVWVKCAGTADRNKYLKKIRSKWRKYYDLSQRKGSLQNIESRYTPASRNYLIHCSMNERTFTLQNAKRKKKKVKKKEGMSNGQ